MDSRCRLCAEAKSVTDFACTIKDKYVNVREMLLHCCGWATFETNEYENLPKLVCISCLDTLKHCWQFWCSVSRAQQQLLYDCLSPTKATGNEIGFPAAAGVSASNASGAPNVFAVHCVTAVRQSEAALTTNENETFEFLDAGWHDNDGDDGGGGGNNSDDYLNDDGDVDVKPSIDDIDRKPIAFADTSAMASDDSDDEQPPSNANNDDFNEMRFDFELMQHVGEDERLPDGTIAAAAIERLRLHDWTFIKNRCYVCGIVCGNYLSFKHHFVANHPNDKMQQACMLCDDVLSSKHKRAQTLHVTRVHLPYLKYCCLQCGLYFWDLKARNKHGSQSHRAFENRSYLCDTCGQGFGNREKYLQHRHTHLPKKPSVRRTYECYLCRQAFRCKVSVERHMWRHAPLERHPFACELCGTKFTRLMSLKRHQLIHAGKNPYVCGACGKEFRTKYNLDVHFRIHTGEKPYGCTICDYRTADGPNLKKHMKQKHGLEKYIRKNS